MPVSFFFEGAPAAFGIPQAAKGTADAPSPAYVADFLATSDGLDLVKAFMSIEDAKLRRAIVRLVEEIVPENACCEPQHQGQGTWLPRRISRPFLPVGTPVSVQITC